MTLAFILIFSLINSCIELEICSPSFNAMLHYFHTSHVMIANVMIFNCIGFCFGALIYGVLADAFGRRRIMLIGNAIVVIGTFICMSASTLSMLLFGRFIQGLGAATSAVVVSAIIADLYSEREAGKLVSVMNAVFTSLMALSPLLGCMIAARFDFRGNFAVMLVITLIAWILLWLNLPESLAQKTLLNLNTVLRLLKKILSHRQFVCSAIVPSLLYGCYLAFVSLSPFLYQTHFHLSMMGYAVNVFIVIMSFSITSLGYRYFGQWFEPIAMIKGAFVLLLVSLGVLFCWQSYIGLTLGLCCFVMSFALIYPIVFAKTLIFFPDSQGTASSCALFLRYLLCAAITALFAKTVAGSVLHFAEDLSVMVVLVVLLSCYLIRIKLLCR